MSKVAIKGNASGTGTFTVEAPNSNTDRTLVLPDEAGTVLTSGGGHLVVDQYYPSAHLTGNQNPISNWVRNTRFFSPIGGGVSVSSGIFSFPVTGMYRIHFHATLDENGSGGDNNVNISIIGSDDNFSTNSLVARVQTAIYSGNNRTNGTVQSFFNCTDISNDKVRFDVDSFSDQLFGTSNMTTVCTFERVGDAQ